MAGAGKKPRRERTGEVRPLSRARNQVREPRRRQRAQAGAGTHAGYARKKGPGAWEALPATAERRKAERDGKRYAGMARRNAGKGMANMTSHDKT